MSSIYYFTCQDYQQKNLFKDDTDAVFIQCTLDLTLTVHEWVNVFLSIKQSERLKQINVYGNISKVPISNVTIHI